MGYRSTVSELTIWFLRWTKTVSTMIDTGDKTNPEWTALSRNFRVVVVGVDFTGMRRSRVCG